MDFLSVAGQVLVAGFPAGDPPAPLLAATREGALGGVILFRRNIDSAAQVLELTRRFADAAPADRPALIAVDQEGGRVARLGAPVLRLPPMRRLGELDDAGLTRRAGRVLGRQLAALGFTMDFAPVLDVDTNPKNPVIGDRSFGSRPDVVTRHGLAFAAGLEDGGCLSCGKHFPGHGDTDLDSHLALPTLPHGRERLDAVELAPFRAAAGKIPALMTAHVIFEALDPGVPATLSRRVITGLLREELGYDGVVISDDLEMKAVSARWGVRDSAIAAIAAGCDVLLVCSDVEACLDARGALAAKAEGDPAFAERLREAAQRSLSLRLRRPPAPVTGAALAAALAEPEVGELEAALSPEAPEC